MNTPPVPPAYITFSSPAAFTLSIIGSVKLWDGIVEYSTDGESWSEWSGLTTLPSGVKDGGNVLYVRGEGNTIITGPSAGTAKGAWHFSGTNIMVSGMINSLLDYHGVTLVGASAFKNWLGWKSPGDTALVSAENLIISDPISAGMCEGMFSRCKGLLSPPKFAAQNLESNCYKSVFYQCSGLNKLPALPALTLATSCYESMFLECTSIKMSQTKTGDYQNEYRVPIEGTGTNATNATYSMFNSTGGSFAPISDGMPINTTIYTSNDVAP
jgi:hypothetical protein